MRTPKGKYSVEVPVAGTVQIGKQDDQIDMSIKVYIEVFDWGHNGIFDPISGFAEPPCGPEYEISEVELKVPETVLAKGDFVQPVSIRFLELLFGPEVLVDFYEEIDLALNEERFA